MIYFDLGESFDNLWNAFLRISLSSELDFILLFLLFFAVVYTVLEKRFFQKQRAVSAIIAVSVSMLATYFLSYEGFEIQMFTYNLFALFLTISLSLAIMVYFIHQVNLLPGFRKALLFAYGIVLFVVLDRQGHRFLEGYLDIIFIVVIALLIIFDKRINDSILGM